MTWHSLGPSVEVWNCVSGPLMHMCAGMVTWYHQHVEKCWLRVWGRGRSFGIRTRNEESLGNIRGGPGLERPSAKWRRNAGCGHRRG